jgi:hypothetical protein
MTFGNTEPLNMSFEALSCQHCRAKMSHGSACQQKEEEKNEENACGYVCDFFVLRPDVGLCLHGRLLQKVH